MREPVTIDLRGLYEQLAAMPDKRVGPHFHPWTSDEEWILWEMWERKKQPDTAKALKRCAGVCRARYEELKKQGGPQGKRPEWMK